MNFMATAAQTQSWDRISRRRTVRRALHATVDATVMRAGTPDTLPGRAVNLCEGGLAAVLAGELCPGEMVAVEILLPATAAPLRVGAVVKHCTKLYSGMEFIGLSAEQREVIRSWTGVVASPATTAGHTRNPAGPVKNSLSDGGRSLEPRQRRSGRWVWLIVVLAAALAALAWWWNWNRGWKELESGINKDETAVAPIHPEVQVPADVMQKLVEHRVDPEYPAAARSKNLQAVIVLDVIVGRDGSVLDVHSRNGPDVLAQSAMDAMRWWRFEPYRVDGRPVIVETTAAMEFNP